MEMWRRAKNDFKLNNTYNNNTIFAPMLYCPSTLLYMNSWCATTNYPQLQGLPYHGNSLQRFNLKLLGKLL
jgi:hypothetical protein